MPAGAVGQALHGPFPGRIDALFRGEAGQQHGVQDLFQMPRGDGRAAVTIGNHFALFGDADAAVHGPVRLRQDGLVGRPAAAANRRRRGRERSES